MSSHTFQTSGLMLEENTLAAEKKKYCEHV